MSLFDDHPVAHGNPGEAWTFESEYTSPTTVIVPYLHELGLFAHFVWIGSIQLARLISDGTLPIAGHSVLEFGAASGLAGIQSLKVGSMHTRFSDYPEESLLSTLQSNIQGNWESTHQRASVVGHQWGESTNELLIGFPDGFTRVIAADTLWMEDQHRNLLQSICNVLSKKETARVYICAGYHTGRRTVSKFFTTAGNEFGLVPDHQFAHSGIWEYGVENTTRPWADTMSLEEDDIVKRKKWVVVAVLCRNHL